LKADEFAELSTGRIFTRFAPGNHGEKMGKRLAKRLAEQVFAAHWQSWWGPHLIESKAWQCRNVHRSHSDFGRRFTMNGHGEI